MSSVLGSEKYTGGTIRGHDVKTKRTDILKKEARAFACSVVKLSRKLRNEKESILAAQFLRSGTSIGANLAEGRNSQTRGDRLAKHFIALKEAGETLYWRELFSDLKIISPKSEFSSMLDDCEAIMSLLKEVISCDRAAKKREERRMETMKRLRRDSAQQEDGSYLDSRYLK